jgi:phage major head subunit gpT-like protein
VNVGYGLWQLAYGSKQALTPANYASARSAMMSFKGDNGKPLGIRPSLLVVPPSLDGDGRAILLSERDAAGATNQWRNTAQLLTTSWLA